MSDFNRNYDADHPVESDLADPRIADPLVVDSSMPPASRASQVGLFVAILLFTVAGGYWIFHLSDTNGSTPMASSRQQIPSLPRP